MAIFLLNFEAFTQNGVNLLFFKGSIRGGTQKMRRATDERYRIVRNKNLIFTIA